MVVHFVRACVGPVRECCRRQFVTLRGEALQFTIYNHLSPPVCKFFATSDRRSRITLARASVRHTERALAIKLRRAGRTISMFYNRAGVATLYEQRLDGHRCMQSARSSDSRHSAKTEMK